MFIGTTSNFLFYSQVFHFIRGQFLRKDIENKWIIIAVEFYIIE